MVCSFGAVTLYYIKLTSFSLSNAGHKILNQNFLHEQQGWNKAFLVQQIYVIWLCNTPTFTRLILKAIQSHSCPAVIDVMGSALICVYLHSTGTCNREKSILDRLAVQRKYFRTNWHWDLNLSVFAIFYFSSLLPIKIFRHRPGTIVFALHQHYAQCGYMTPTRWSIMNTLLVEKVFRGRMSSSWILGCGAWLMSWGFTFSCWMGRCDA